MMRAASLLILTNDLARAVCRISSEMATVQDRRRPQLLQVLNLPVSHPQVQGPCLENYMKA